MSHDDAKAPDSQPNPDEPEGATPPGDEVPDQNEDLGDSGKKALAAERAARRKAENERKALNAELEKLREATQSDQEKALNKARKEGQQAAETEWKTKWRKERVTSEAMRLMNGRVSDPRLALPHLDLGDDVLDDDGTVDRKALQQAIDGLLDEYPALAVADPPTHHGDLGPKRSTRAPLDMNSLLRQAAGRG